MGTHPGQGETSGRPHQEGHLSRRPGGMGKCDPCPKRTIQVERTVPRREGMALGGRGPSSGWDPGRERGLRWVGAMGSRMSGPAGGSQDCLLTARSVTERG